MTAVMSQGSLTLYTLVTMATVRFLPDGREIDVPEGDNLRDAALRADVRLYAGVHRVLNCRGRGRCTGCMVRLAEGTGVNASPKTFMEKLRLKLSRGAYIEDARLACQTAVHGDLVVETRVGTVAGVVALVRRIRGSR